MVVETQTVEVGSKACLGFARLTTNFTALDTSTSGIQIVFSQGLNTSLLDLDPEDFLVGGLALHSNRSALVYTNSGPLYQLNLDPTNLSIQKKFSLSRV